MAKPTLHEDWIDLHARKIVHSLQTAGFETYLVGGCVRDLLVGIHPKDYDIATNAQPEDVRKKVSGSHIIGRRFRLVLARRHGQQFEIATFRRSMNETDVPSEEEGVVTGDNFFGTAQEDAQRRDFTVNALFFDPINHKLIDFVEGLKDIEDRTLRMIGDPVKRFEEDPIRILRAVRLSHKIHFQLEASLRQAALSGAAELQKSILPRRREEYLKIMRLDEPYRAFIELLDLGALKEILPTLAKLLEDPQATDDFRFILSRIPDAGLDFSQPGEVFSTLMFAVVFAKSNQKTLEYTPKVEAELLSFMRDELGMFKTEMAQFLNALELLPTINTLDAFLKRGRRRQEGFLRNESLPMALKLGVLDTSIPTPTLLFWIQALSQLRQSPHPESH